MTLTEISASMRSVLISLEDIFECWHISVRVLVRSTSESRPSSAERRMTDMCGRLDSLLVADSMDGTWGARKESAAFRSPKYDESLFEIALCVAGTYPFRIPSKY
jgi:hypothetical protein